jgi:hypothetical protein
MTPQCKDWLSGAAVNPSHMHVKDKEAEDMLCSSHLMTENEKQQRLVCQRTEGMGRAAVPLNALALCLGGLHQPSCQTEYFTSLLIGFSKGIPKE